MSKVIYATPFKQSTKEVTGPSVDSGFVDLDQVQEMVPGAKRIAKRIVTVGDDEDRIAYSDFVFKTKG